MHAHRSAAKGKRQSVQLSEWWADFDERVMKPVFNKPDALESWTPRSDGTPEKFMACVSGVCE